MLKEDGKIKHESFEYIQAISRYLWILVDTQNPNKQNRTIVSFRTNIKIQINQEEGVSIYNDGEGIDIAEVYKGVEGW